MFDLENFIAHKPSTYDAYVSMGTLDLPLAKSLMQGLWQTELCTDPSAEAGKVDINHFFPQNPNSSKIKVAKQRNTKDENEVAFDQHETHLDRKRTTANKLGNVTVFLDGLRTIVNVSILSLIAEQQSAKMSIFSQIMLGFASFFSSVPFTNWATFHAADQPQLPFLMIRYAEQSMCNLAKASTHHGVTSKIEAKAYDKVPTQHYRQAVLALKDCHELFLALMRSKTKITMVPSSCPDDFNPDLIANKKMRRDLTFELANSSGQRQLPRDRPAAAPAGGAAPAPAPRTPAGHGVPGRGGRGAGRGGRGGREGGRGGRGGRGGHDGGTTRDPKTMGSFFVANNTSPTLIPATVLRPYCQDWLYVGRSCTSPYSECVGWHGNFDRISIAADKKIIADHVARTPGIWFNVNNVRSLTEAAHTQQLGGSAGPAGTI